MRAINIARLILALACIACGLSLVGCHYDAKLPDLDTIGDYAPDDILAASFARQKVYESLGDPCWLLPLNATTQTAEHYIYLLDGDSRAASQLPCNDFKNPRARYTVVAFQPFNWYVESNEFTQALAGRLWGPNSYREGIFFGWFIGKTEAELFETMGKPCLSFETDWEGKTYVIHGYSIMIKPTSLHTMAACQDTNELVFYLRDKEGETITSMIIEDGK